MKVAVIGTGSKLFSNNLLHGILKNVSLKCAYKSCQHLKSCRVERISIRESTITILNLGTNSCFFVRCHLKKMGKACASGTSPIKQSFQNFTEFFAQLYLSLILNPLSVLRTPRQNGESLLGSLSCRSRDLHHQ